MGLSEQFRLVWYVHTIGQELLAGGFQLFGAVLGSELSRFCRGQEITAFIQGMAAVASDPMPTDILTTGCGVQCLPQIHIFYLLPPTPCLPGVYPFGDSVAEILGICEDIHLARLFQPVQRLQRSGKFHSVVGGSDDSAAELFSYGTVFENGRPATWPGISFACAVCMNDNLFQNVVFIAGPYLTLTHDPPFEPEAEKGKGCDYELGEDYETFYSTLLVVLFDREKKSGKSQRGADCGDGRSHDHETFQGNRQGKHSSFRGCVE